MSLFKTPVLLLCLVAVFQRAGKFVNYIASSPIMALDRLHSLEMKVYIVSASTHGQSNRILSQKTYDR